MPLQISNYNIDFLSGPRSITCLIPNSNLYQALPLKNTLKNTNELVRIPPLLFLGDQHKNIEGACSDLKVCSEDSNKKANCISMIKDEWFKLLDSLCTTELKIDYFIESNFPTVLMNNIADERFRNMIHVSSDVMMYIPVNYFQCFLTNTNTMYLEDQTKKDKICITNNIRYHFIDTRYDLSYFNLKRHELEVLCLSNMMMRQNVFGNEEVNDIMKRVKSKIKDTTAELFLNKEFNFIDEDKPVFIHYNQLNLARHLPNFESYLSYCIDNLVDKDLYPYTKQFYNEKTFDLVTLACFNTREFITTLVNLPQFKHHSMLYKQIKKSVFEDQSLVELFIEYYCYCISKETIIKNLKVNIKRLAGKFTTDYYNTYNLTTVRALSRIKQSIINSSAQRLESSYYRDIYGYNLGGLIVAPFIDFYFLCITWKPSILNNSQMCVFNAGVHHTSTLKKFLANVKMFYDIQFDLGYDSISDVSTAIPIMKRLTYNPLISSSNGEVLYDHDRNLSHKLYEQDVPMIRCLEFKKNIVHSIDQIIYFSYLVRGKQHLEEINAIQSLYKRRKTFFGDMYDKILLGYKLTQDEFKLICDHHNLTTQDAIKKFNLKVISEVSF